MTHERNIYLEDIPLDEARLRLENALRQIARWEALPGETIPLTEALGRVTAEPVWAKISSPNYHAAAMDGYAVHASDTHVATETRPVRLNLTAQPLSASPETSPLNPLSVYREGTSRQPDSPSPFTGLGGGVDWTANEFSGPWRTPAELWEKLKPLAREMRHEATPAETALWEAIRNRQIENYKFRRQHSIDRFIVDFYCAEARLVIEVDGEIHQYTREEDALRTAFLESQGLRVIRFQNDAVLNDLDDVLSRIRILLTSPPHPLSANPETSPLNSLSVYREGTSTQPDSPSPFTERGLGGEVNMQRGLGGEIAYPVDTGDPLPRNTNAVIMIEDVQQVDDGILIRAPVAPWQHVRLMGEDMVVTELVLPANHVLRPVDLGVIAGCGHHTVSVRRKPLVVIIPTGDELIPPGQPPQPGQIIEYNSLVLSGQIANAGGRSQVTEIISDDPALLRQAISDALEQQPDLILVLSGSSAGSEDFTASIIREMGELLVHGVAVRPGHPVIMGMVQSSPPSETDRQKPVPTPILGIPGYPVSAALTGELFVLPLLAQWLGIQPLHDTLPRAQATITHKLVSPIGDDDFVRVTVAQVGQRLLATPLSRGAGVMTSLMRADGLARIPRFSEGVDIGGSVEVMLYRSLESIKQSVLMMGSHDPMIDLLGQYLAERLPGCRLVSSHIGSMGGLVALRRGETHLAGIHLLDPESVAFNWPYVRKYLPDISVQLVTFAHREQGLIVAPGNPLSIGSIDDLPRLRYVNRQRGAGTRVLLDYELQKRGITPESIAGYDHEEYTHLGVAAAVASGIADCGLGVRSGAIALELDFVPVSWERYDIVVPDVHRQHPAVVALLDVLNSTAFREALAAQPGYDARETGKTQSQS